MLDIDPSTYVVPANQALLYSVVEDETTFYKYRLTTGEPGDVTLNALSGLGIDPESDLPCLVYSADLLDIINDQSTLDGRTIAVSTHAIAKYVKRFFAQKYDFLTKLAEINKDNAAHAADTVKHITTLWVTSTKRQPIPKVPGHAGSTCLSHFFLANNTCHKSF